MLLCFFLRCINTLTHHQSKPVSGTYKEKFEEWGRQQEIKGKECSDMVHHLRKDSGYLFPHFLGYRELTIEPTVKFGTLELRDLILPK